MSDRLSALAPVYRPGLHGTTSPGHAAVTLQERRGLSMLLLACYPEDRDALGRVVRDFFNLQLTELNRAQIAGDTSLLWQGPNRWLLVAPDQRQGDLTEALDPLRSAHPAIGVTDLSHARSIIRMSGPSVRSLLAKECTLDLEPPALPKGSCVMTGFSHYAVTLHMVEEEVIDLYITRSFAQALWEELIDLGAEYGLRVEGAIS